jgi:hypothetical protein
MNKYSMVIDPVRSKNFAVIIQKKNGLSFIPLNEMAKEWAGSQSKVANIGSVNVPDGMYISSPSSLSKAQEIMLEHSIKSTGDVVDPKMVYAGRHSTGKSSSGKSIVGKQIRKVPKNLKLKTINYKASAFKNRYKRSSAISAIKINGLSIDEKTSKFRKPKLNSLEVLEKSAGQSLSRRVAANYFVKDISKNRLSRRAKTLTVNEAPKSVKSDCSKSIEVAISAKASRFI